MTSDARLEQMSINQIRRIERAAIVARDQFIGTETPGIELFLRNKRRARPPRSVRAPVLMIHGATYPGSATFDARLAGISMMDELAASGLDAWVLDLRGYGRSSRPPEMDGPMDAAPPAVDASLALTDIGRAVAHILAETGSSTISLVGWSWGTSLCSRFATAYPMLVEKLVVIAPLWKRDAPTPPPPTDLGAFRTATVGDIRTRWLEGLAPEAVARLAPADWIDSWLEQLMSSDPVGAQQKPPVIRAPNGVIVDVLKFWSTGVPPYDPNEIRCPVLVTHGEWDAELPLSMARGYFMALTQARYRRWVEIGESTHAPLLEANRFQLFGAITTFLTETYQPEI